MVMFASRLSFRMLCPVMNLSNCFLNSPLEISTSRFDEEPSILRLPLPVTAISFIDTALAFRDAVIRLMAYDLIAFDAEFRFLLPVSHPGSERQRKTHPGVTLLQLAVRDRVFIIDVNALSELPRVDWWYLGRVITDPDKTKLGFGISCDLTMLARSIPKLAPHLERRANVVDLETVIANLERVNAKSPTTTTMTTTAGGNLNGGLAGAVSRYLGHTLDKTVQKLNWDRRPLRPKQLHYAALDAFVLLLLRDAVLTKISETGVDANLVDLARKDFALPSAAEASGESGKEFQMMERTVRVLGKSQSRPKEPSPLAPLAFGRGHALANGASAPEVAPVGRTLSRVHDGEMGRSRVVKLVLGRGSDASTSVP